MVKFTDFSCKFIRVFGIILIGYLFLQGLFTICCIQAVTEKTFYVENGVIRQFLGIVLAIALMISLTSPKISSFIKKHHKLILASTFISVIVFYALWINLTKFTYASDMEKIFQYAGMLLEGDYSGWTPGGYPYEWSQQNTLILFVAFLLKHFDLNTSFMAFYYVNLAAYAVSLISLSVILRCLFPDKNTCTLQMLSALLYFPFGFLITMLYGDMISFSLGIASIALIYMYLKRKRIIYIVGSCISIILAVCFRQNELIFFIGIVILLLYELCLSKEGRRNSGIMITVAYVVVSVIGFGLPKYVMENITGMDIGFGNSRLAHIAMGLQESEKAPGWYNGYVEQVFRDSNYDTETANRLSEKKIEQMIEIYKDDPKSAWDFFNCKIASEWNNPTFECFNIQNSRLSFGNVSPIVYSVIRDGGKLNILLTILLDIAQSITLFGVIMYLLLCRSSGIKELLFLVLFIGGFTFFLFWEAKCRYVVPFYFLLLPYAVLGYQSLIKKRVVMICSVLVLFLLMIGFMPGNVFKLNGDTSAYYEYIHQYDKNFMWLSF